MTENRHGVLPFGFKFKPKNTELIWYLLHKVHGLQLPCDHFIIDCDLYDERDLWKQIFDGSPAATTHLFFFTKLKKITGKGTVNRNRRTGRGRWKETQNCGTIYDPNKNPKKPIGNKRSFKFEPNKDAAAEFPGRWLMDEFSLDPRFSHQNTEDYVVCCIKHEADKKSRNNVERTMDSERLIQENSTNARNANSTDDTTAATTLDPEDGLADIDLDELMALLDDNDQTLAAVTEENGRDSDCQFATTTISSGSRNNVERTTDSERLIQENSTNARNANSTDDTTAATTLDPEDGLADIDLDELMALLDNDQTLAAVTEENGRDSDCQFATTTISSGSGSDFSNSSTNTDSFLIDTPNNAGHGFLEPLD